MPIGPEAEDDLYKIDSGILEQPPVTPSEGDIDSEKPLSVAHIGKIKDVVAALQEASIPKNHIVHKIPGNIPKRMEDLLFGWGRKYPDWVIKNIHYKKDDILFNADGSITLGKLTIVGEAHHDCVDEEQGIGEYKEKDGQKRSTFEFDAAQDKAESLGLRVPSAHEQQVLIQHMPGENDEEKYNNLCTFLNLSQGGYYWSSDKVSTTTGKVIYFYKGYTGVMKKTEKHFALLVK